MRLSYTVRKSSELNQAFRFSWNIPPKRDLCRDSPLQVAMTAVPAWPRLCQDWRERQRETKRDRGTEIDRKREKDIKIKKGRIMGKIYFSAESSPGMMPKKRAGRP